MTPLHRAARSYASVGIPVFPCRENGKEPATANGFKDASADLAQIDAWWTENPNYNVALCPNDAGWCVVDLDTLAGIENWHALLAEFGWPEPHTRVIETPRAGRHVYFEGELPPTTSKLAEKVDTRGIGSYVLVPPSIVNGKPYKVIHDADIITLPPWIADRIATSSVAAKAAVCTLDMPANLARGRALLSACTERADVAVAGAGGNSRTYSLACELLNLGLSVGAAQSLLEEIWNPACVPPWSSEELDTIFENATRYAQNEPGAWGVGTAAEAFGPALDKLAMASPQDRRSRFYAEDESEQDCSPDPAWLIPEILPDEEAVLIVGPKGNFKTFIAQEMLLAIAAKVQTFGAMPLRSGPVFYGAHENRKTIKRKRRHAWRIARGIEGRIPFYVLPGPRVAVPEDCDEFREAIRERLRQGADKIAGIVLDTVAKCMIGLDENSARDSGIYNAFVQSLIDEFECPVISLHHTRKDGTKGSRGSGALEAGHGTVIDVDRKGLAVAVSVRYHKDAEEREAPWTFQGRNVGPSLVFFPTSAEEHRELVTEDDAFDPRKIGAALQTLNAYGEDNAVTTRVLAATLVPPVETDGVEKREAALAIITRKLGSMARARLRAYCRPVGGGLAWSLPPRAA